MSVARAESLEDALHFQMVEFLLSLLLLKTLQHDRGSEESGVLPNTGMSPLC